MKEPVSIRCRLIGTTLREHRERAGWTVEEAARLLGCDRSKIRIEAGARNVIPAEASRLLDEYAADPGGREALTALATAGTTRGWWEDFRALLSPGYRDIMATEHAATHITIYAPVAIPELLHTEGYARALTVAGQIPDHMQGKAVAATMARQKAILAARPAQVSVLLAAAALRQRPADATVIRDQLRYLADLTDAHPRVTIQLLPLTASLHAAGGSGTFTILRFSHDPAPTLVLADGPGGGTFLDSQHTAAAYQHAHDELRVLALTQEESAQWLRRMSGDKARHPGTLPPTLASRA